MIRLGVVVVDGCFSPYYNKANSRIYFVEHFDGLRYNRGSIDGGDVLGTVDQFRWD